jgi:hypothetical protein
MSFITCFAYPRFVQQKLGGPSISDYEKLKAEKLDLQLKYNELLDTHKETCRQVRCVLCWQCVLLCLLFCLHGIPIFSCSAAFVVTTSMPIFSYANIECHRNVLSD